MPTKVTTRYVFIDCPRHGKTRVRVQCEACRHDDYLTSERARLGPALAEFGFAIPPEAIGAWTEDELFDVAHWAGCRWVWSNDIATGPMPKMPAG